MRDLICFEIKKIVKKKSFVLALVLFLGLQTLIAVLGAFGNVYIDTGSESALQDNDYVVLESFAERNRIDRKTGKELSGRVFDDALLAEMSEAFAPYMDAENEAFKLSNDYKQNARCYEGVFDRLRSYVGWYRRGYQILLQISDEETLYAKINEDWEEIRDYYNLTEGEQAYWEKRSLQLPGKRVYEYSTAFEELCGMQGVYMTHMLLVFLFALTTTGVFLVEANRNTDQMILCTKKGRGQLYAAKLIAGCIVTFALTLLFSAVLFVGRVCTYGPEGFSARVTDALAPWYPTDMTLGQMYLLLLLALFLASVLLSLIAMLLSWATKNGIVSVAVLVGGVFVARLVPIPSRFRFLAKLWNMIPINLLKIDAGFMDMRLFCIFGGYVTIWQMALILYVLAIAVLIAVGKRLYCRTQICGR